MATEYQSLESRAIALARELQSAAGKLITRNEQAQLDELASLLEHPPDKVTVAQLTDQAFRSRSTSRGINQFQYLLETRGIPHFFGGLEKLGLQILRSIGRLVAFVALPLSRRKIRQDTADVILRAEHAPLTAHLRRRHAEGLRMNVNLLGEAVLGETEAARMLVRYLEMLALPEVEVVSVKISTLYSQINPLAREHTIAVLSERLEKLFLAAAEQTFTRPNGDRVAKFVYLDMEEYRDMHLTADAFMQTLDRDGMEQVSAGIVLQAYLPDAYVMQQKLNAWAHNRVLAGGAPIRLRLVKGANMEMERIEAAINGWPQAPFKVKADSDANFKRMLHEAMIEENLAAVRPGIASHNLFDLAYGLLLVREQGASSQMRLEMLEGMATHQRRALANQTDNLLLYAPACHDEEFISAIGYLIRRLDENTGPDNFLRHAFHITVDDPEWSRLEEMFLESVYRIKSLSDTPNRQQDRRQPPVVPKIADDWREFSNEPNTDFALPQNGEWVQGIIKKWEQRHGDSAKNIPLTVAGRTVIDERFIIESKDPSRPENIVVRMPQANAEDLQRAVACAKADPSGWRTIPMEERATVLARTAQLIREARADLIGAAMADGGKLAPESDSEISEAIDFVEFYPRTVQALMNFPNITSQPKGVVAVIAPWNFPIAIPCGGVAAALATGNTVLLKPSSDTLLPAYYVCECFWNAGVPHEALQLLPCPGQLAEEHLVESDCIDVVILTGGTETAKAMLRTKPTLNLLAETGGKNATIVTAMADRDQAIKHVLLSAFGHAGQKCSATALLLLESEVFDDPKFKRSLRDAVESLTVGSAWELQTKVNPLIRPASGDLARAREKLDPGEQWLVPPLPTDNPHLASPVVKWNVRPGAPTHCKELFGPVLGVMRYKDLNEAIDFIHQTGFGLTSGIETLDEREQEYWQSRVRAGNLYINRPTTGAVVLRQPFGGMGLSAFGPGIKAGGPNYVAQLMDFEEIGEPDGVNLNNAKLKALATRVPSVEPALCSYTKQVRDEFHLEHDHFQLLGQDNIRRYCPIDRVCICLHADDTAHEIAARLGAAISIGCTVTITGPGAEDWSEFSRILPELNVKQCDRLRYASPDRVPNAIRHAANEAGIYIADTPVLSEGRLELLWYIEEQSVSNEYHRHGNLGSRAGEFRNVPT